MTDPQIPTSKGTILVVDDNPDIVTITKTILEGKGFEVQTAINGLEAFSRLEEKKPDLIILDVMLPQMDGLEVLRKIKETPDYLSIPVILLTAKVQHEDVLKGYKLGVDYYITKPFNSSQLINGINYVLNKDQDQLYQDKQFIKACLAVNAK